LISTDFPKNIEPLLETISHHDPSLYGDDCADLECRRNRLKQDILESVGLYEWSPNGQELAFTAQIEGPSSDIYIYSLQDGSIRRLTDDLNTARGMHWSPDGKWILYTNDIPGTSLLTDVLGPNDFAKTLRYVTDMEGKSFELSLPALSAEGDYWIPDGWITRKHYLFHDSSYRQLAVLDAENQQVTKIWTYTMKYFLFDKNTQTIVLLLESENDPNLPTSGVYRVTLDGYYEKIGNPIFYNLWPSPEILGIGAEKVYHITSDNSFKPIGPGESVLHSSSPNKKWFLINEGHYQRRYRFTLYSDTYQPIKSWMFDDYVLDTIWRPDSLGVFFFTDNDVYYVDIPEGELRHLEVELHPSSDECEQTMCVGVCSAWLP